MASADNKEMVALVRAGARAVGIDPGDVRLGRGVVGIIGTGVELSWTSGPSIGGGVATGGWKVTETYHVIEEGSGQESTRTDTVGVFGTHDRFDAMVSAIMAVARRRVIAAMTQGM